MSVQNFLEDEDYGAGAEESSVPNFLRDEEDDEEYDGAQDGEYYGGGFSDGVEPRGSSADFGESFLSAGDEDEELFDGSDLFGGSADSAASSGAEDSPYGISGLPQRVAKAPGSSRSELSAPAGGAAGSTTEAGGTTSSTHGGDSTTSPTTLSTGSTDPDEPSSSVPNFLEDEDEDESPRGSATVSVPAPGGSSGRASVSGGTKGGTPKSSTGIDGSSVPAAAQILRPRRDLSRRPQADVPSSPGVETPVAVATPTPRSSTSEASRRDVGNGGSAPSAPSLPRATTPTVAVAFDPRAKVQPVSGEEAAELKAPSSYAAGRELKYTALLQKEATLRRVGSDGLTAAERARAAKGSGATLRTPANGKLSENELLFYANLGAQRSIDYGSSSKKELFLPPVLGESAEDKREREARINRSLADGSMVRGSKTRLTEKDYNVLRFMGIFKFVSERQIAKLLQVAEHSAYKRLNLLRKHGLTKSFKVLGVKGSVWVLTETGMDLSGYDLPRGTEGALTLSMISHQFTVNHVAAHLWSGGANVLREKNFPQRNRLDGAGEPAFGERLVSELQIQSVFGKLRGTTKADAYVPQIKKHMANQFDSWQRAGGADFGPSPEFQRGNEYMWMLFPPVSNRLNYHVPDLVVARPRGADGKPQSIAVEIELKTKADESSYERTLDAYRTDGTIFKKVVWICRLKGTAEKLSQIAKRNGLADQGKIAIVPIYLEDGSRFTGKDTWSL